MTTVTSRESAQDDGGTHRSVGSHAWNSTTAKAQLGFETGQENLGSWSRFLAVNIPRGAKIDAAKITFQANASNAETVVNARIDGLASDNAGTPTHDEFDGGSTQSAGHGRATANRTTAQVSWSGITTITGGQNYDTPDFASVVQEIVDRAGWVNGNAMTIYVGDEDEESDQIADHRRIWDDWDADNANAPLLTVEFTATRSRMLLIRGGAA